MTDLSTQLVIIQFPCGISIEDYKELRKMVRTKFESKYDEIYFLTLDRED